MTKTLTVQNREISKYLKKKIVFWYFAYAKIGMHTQIDKQ